MKKSLPTVIATLLLLFAACRAFSQQLKFNKVISPLGSFSGAVGGITQDKSGYMWFATSGGLYRYDGYRFKLYANDPSDTTSIAGTHLETLYTDRQGMIWIATWIDGLDRLNPQTGVFSHFRHDPKNPASLSNDTVRAIMEDRDGMIWVGTSSGLDRFDPKTGVFKNYHNSPDDPGSLSCNRVRVLYEDKQGTLWVGTGSAWPNEGSETEGGLNRFDKKEGRFIRYLHDPANPQSLINNKVCALFEDSYGTFWVGTAGDGLHTMDRRTGTVTRHTYDPAHPERVSRPPVNKNVYIDYIGFINEDATGDIWIGTLGNGINRYDPKKRQVVHFGADTTIGFTNNSGWCYYNSRDGVAWIGSYDGAGLYRVDPFHKTIPYVAIPEGAFGFDNDPASGLWIGTGQGLFLLNKEHEVLKKFVHEPKKPTSLSADTIYNLYRDGSGVLWIGTANGLNRFDASKNTFVRYQNNPKDTTSIRNGAVVAMTDAGRDSLWIGTTAGLELMNKRTGVFTHYNRIATDQDAVVSLVADDRQNLWMGIINGGGLVYFDRGTGTVKTFLKGISVNAILKDSRGTLWAGTDVGLFKTANPANGFTKFTDSGSSVEINIVGPMEEDNQKNIWSYTSSGIYRINIETGQTTVFGPDNGIKENGGFYQVSYKDADGTIYFGDFNGYYVIAPNRFASSGAAPQLALTDFRIDGKSVPASDSTGLAYAFENEKAVTLSHNQNTFSFDFAGIHYTNPEYNRQLYMLENFDPTWRDARYEKTAYYYNVPPGHYTLKVKAASSEGVWAEKDISITITPPWWRTWWAYTVYALLFAAMVYAVHRFQKQRVIRAERERARVRELAQAKEIEKAYQELKATQAQLIQSEKMASLGELTAGIAHEIQNPLNFVNNFSEVNTELLKELEQELDNGKADSVKAIAKDIRENEQKISYHGKRADAIVKSMLQHSRVSTGIKEPTDINALADEYLRLSYHGLRAKDKTFNATFKTYFDESIGNVNVVPQDIGRVLLNLFNNAFYAANQTKKQAANQYEPTVVVRTKKHDDKIEIQVCDNGMGISKSLQDKIFQPFFTTKPPGEGTGLGLSLSYDIIKAHGGEIKVESSEREGTRFTIWLPFA